VAVLLLAFVIDVALGDPPNRWHPVAWMGRAIAAARRRAPSGPPWLLVLYGGATVGIVAGASAAAVALVQRSMDAWTIPALLVDALLLKGVVSLRGLRAAVRHVAAALGTGDIDRARWLLGFHLVSRPTGDLDAGQVASGAVESLAENLTDSWLAPLCFFVVGGLPAAWAYRAVNTADAMIGYRDGVLEHLGKAAARLDDLLNWIPARLAGLALVAGAALGGESGHGAWSAMRRDGPRTASPNAGRTMAAMAGALGVTLEKTGHYRLGLGPVPDVGVIERAVRVADRAVLLTLAAGLCVLWGLR
jgi:adenosylcobinamide-phosphate synthase